MRLYNEFISIAKFLNKELDIVPVLYGSLGLERVTNLVFDPKDIDILVPIVFLEEKWELLRGAMEQQGYELVDLHEHEFHRDGVKVGVAYVEDLQPFADVDYKGLDLVEDEGASYYSLSVSDYVKVYGRSLLDGYRRTKNNRKDEMKLEMLKAFLQK